MRQVVPGLSMPMLIVSLSSACSNLDGRVTERPSLGEAARIPAMTSIQHCFRNEYPFDDSDTNDIEELTIVVDGDRAAGEYNWRPAYKDKRLGRFSGVIQGNAISASYEFEQEGRLETTAISISIEEGQAIIEGGPPEFGLNQILPRVDC